MEKNQVVPAILRLMVKWLPLFVVVLVSAATILFLSQRIEAKKSALARQQSQAAVNRPAPQVVTLEMAPKLLEETLSLPGTAKPWISLSVVSEVRGKIITKAVTQGDRVKTGDILAQIDPRDYQNSYDAARAAHDTARIAMKRLTALSKNQFVTQSNLDDAVARVKTTRAEMATAKLNLERCTVRSPMDAVVDQESIETGTYLNVGDPLFTLLDISKIKVGVGIPESDVDAVRRLKTFDMTLDALGGKAVEGSYHYLTRTTNSLARLYTLDIRVENPDRIILPDMFARVSIVKHRDPAGLAVPTYALVTHQDETGVFVESEGSVRFQVVKTGFQDGWETQITQGLNPGDAVVVIGHRMVEDGQAVKVIRRVSHMEELNP